MDRAEATGLGVSAAGHVALLGLMSFAVATVRVQPIAPPAMEVSYVDEIGLDAAAPRPSPAPAAAASAPQTGPIEDAAPAPEPAVSAPAPQPRQAEAPPTPPKPARPARPAGASGSGALTRRPGLADLNPSSFGTDPRRRPDAPAAAMGPEQRASLYQAIQRALIRCQRQPLPAPEAAAIKVDVRVSLNRDGSLADAQVIRVINTNPGLAIYERRMRDLALNVINACTPIRGLPAELYDVPRGWRQFPYQFDPRLVR